MARIQFTALDVNGTGTDTIFCSGDLGLNNTDIVAVNDIYLDDINADGTKIDLQDDMDTGSVTIYSDSGNLVINEGGVGTEPTTFGYGPASFVGTEYDVYIRDDLDVAGTLSKGSGSFKINHPLDPENKYLYHSFVESPEMRNEYYGQSDIVDGKAIVEMPDWWHALNGEDKSEFNYQLTPIGKQANLWIIKELENGKFEIGSDVDCKVSWRVSGIRHDKFAEENRIQVEVPKNKKVIEKDPTMWMTSDRYDYDEEVDRIYKLNKKDLFLKQKPHLIRMKELNEKKQKLKEEKRELNKKRNKFVITGSSKKEIKEKMAALTNKDKKEREDFVKKNQKNKLERKSLKKEIAKEADSMRKINKEWKEERNKKRFADLKKKK